MKGDSGVWQYAYKYKGFSPALRWYSVDCPRVSIIILNFNKAHLTVECLKSIWEHTWGYCYEVIVVDNGSQFDDFRVLSEFKGSYKLLHLNINRFFGEGNNIGAELAQGEFLLFMNNDVIVTPNWLPPLMDAFRDHSDCGVAGPKFIYPNGLLQEAGALLDKEGGAVQIGKFQDPDSPRFNRGRVVDYVSAATMLMRKQIFEDVLGFDYIFEPAYYEDADLCLKIGQLGLKTYYVPESCVIHHENATTSDKKNGLQLHNMVAINREKFVHRWSSYLKTGRHNGSIPTITPLIREAPRGTGPTAAVFTPYNIIPGGGERYLLTLAEALLQAGYQVWLVTPEKFSSMRITKIARMFGLTLQGLGITTFKVAEAMPRFNLFVAMDNAIAPPIKPLGQANLYCCQFPFPCTAKEIDRRRDWMTQYDALIVYSDFVRENVLRQLSRYNLPNLDIHVVHPPVDMLSFNSGVCRSDVVSVGRFFTGGHCKQQDMLIKVFRRLYEFGIKTELHLVGSLHPEPQHREYFIECQRLAHGLPIHFHVDASPKTLELLYGSASVYWHGAGFGVDTVVEPEKCEHFGISIVEAMSAGAIPLVVNNGGPASIVKHGLNGFCYDSEDELIELTRELLAQPEHGLSKMREHARSRATEFSNDFFTATWQALVRGYLNPGKTL